MSEFGLTSYITAPIRLFRMKAQAGLGRRYEKEKTSDWRRKERQNWGKAIQVHLPITIQLGWWTCVHPVPPTKEKSRKEKSQLPQSAARSGSFLSTSGSGWIKVCEKYYGIFFWRQFWGVCFVLPLSLSCMLTFMKCFHCFRK